MATISDVAERAGVSTATVSRALNGVSSVDPELVAKVLEAATALGYQPNGPARNLRRRETAVITLIVSDVENPFFTAIARGVEDLAQAAGYSVVLCNTDEDADKERRYLDVAIQERVAGVIISPTGAPTNVGVLLDRGIPVAAVDRPMTDRSSDCVLVDSRLAARDATAHLIERGYTRVGCIAGPEGVLTADDRLAGYHDALRDAGRDEGSELVRRAPYHSGGAREATESLLDGPEPPDALLVSNNVMAIGVLEALGRRHLVLGSDVGVVAFDDVPWATLLARPLSVVAQPAYDVGTAAARLLLARITDTSRPVSTTIFNARLIDRASSALT